MNEQLAFQWLPGILIVAVVAFPAFFFMSQGFAIRLAVASLSVITFLFLFGLVLGHEFHFMRREDIPPLVLGLALGWLLSFAGHTFRKAQTRRHIP